MQRILFVDDEPMLLSGLRRMLRGFRGEWDMEFAGSGAEALTRSFEQPFDVVVSDMRMPIMDGSELLRLIRERFPATVRMVLSGQCDRHAVLKAVGPAHQFLTKPCDSGTLRDSLSRVCRLRDRMTACWPREMASRIEAVPSLPEGLAALNAELADPDGCTDRAGWVISRDPGMAVRVLQLVNSGFFGSPQQTPDPRLATGLLGLERLRELADQTEAFTAPTLDEPRLASIADLVEHSRTVSEAAKRIAAAESDEPDLIADSRWGGLFHDIGKLMLLQQVPERYGRLIETTINTGSIRWHEQHEFNADHAAMGAYLLALWGMPDAVVQIAAMHHAPAESDDRVFTALTAVHVANYLSRARAPAGECGLDHEYLERIGKSHRILAWTKLCQTAPLGGVKA